MVEANYYPSGIEFGILLLVMLQLLIAGYLFKAVLVDKYQLVPIKWATVMLLVAVGVLVIQTSLIKQAAEPERTLAVLWWCFFFSLLPMAYYIKTFVDALSDQTTHRIDQMGTKIEEFSEFAAARKMAQKGDINGAISLYRGYRENRPGALLEAARLLRTEERYAEAVAMFQEISERYPSNKPVWAEATYNLAKIMETNLNQPIGAMQYLVQIKRKVSDTKFAQNADSDLSRLQVMTGKKASEVEVISESKSAENPDMAQIQFPEEMYNRENAAQDLLDAPIPDRDPFMTRDIYTIRGAKPEVKREEKTHKAIAKKAAITRKRPSSSKNTPAKSKTKPAVKTATKKKASAKKKAVAQKASTSSKAKAKATTKTTTKTKAKAKPKAKTSAAKKKAVPKAKASTLSKKKAAAKKKGAVKPAPATKT